MNQQSREEVMTSELRTDVGQDFCPPRELTMARHGIAASSHQFVSETAVDVMRHGGNALDAAVAAAAMLMVVEPRNGHLGGDSFMLFHDAGKNRVVALNGSGAAPGSASVNRYREMGGIPDDGLLTAGVPGTVSCWADALDTYGSKPLSELLEPAISYAESGIPVTPRLHRILTLDAPTYRKFPDSARVFLPGGHVPEVGDSLRQNELANTLRRIVADGPDDFYRGRLARELVAYSDANGGQFSLDDFAQHSTDERSPLSIAYRGFTVYEQPPVSQGIIVLLALGILRNFDLKAYGPGSAGTLHLQIEALKLAFADAARYLGDPRFVEIDIEYLLSEEHASAQAERIDLDRASEDFPCSSPHGDTTFMCVADESGTMVSYIHSLFAGSGVVMGDTGVLMNSRLQGFRLDDGSPNCLAPGKRPVHTLNSYVVQKDGEPVLVGGTPGAHWQVQTNLQILVNALEFGMDVQSAIDAPRFTIGEQLALGDSTVRVESRLGEREIAALRERGHDIAVAGPWEVGGSVQLISRDPERGLYRGASEVRRAGSTVLGF